MYTQRIKRDRILSFLALFCLTASLPAFAAPPEIVNVSFERPTDQFRFYHARVELGATDTGYRIGQMAADDRTDMFVALVNGQLRQLQKDGGVSRSGNGQVPAGSPSVFHLRCPWESGEAYAVTLKGQEEGADAFILEAQATAPGSGGFPYPGWAEHRVLALREDHGIPRENEPFMLFLSEESSLVDSWKRELRVARYDLASGNTTEIPSQVLYEKKRFDTPKQQGVFVTCQLAILADVPANGKAYYLLAYGNPDAEAPSYESDLAMAKRDDGAEWVENAFYEAKIHPDCGQIKGLRSKVYGTGDDQTIGLQESNQYCLHYNPDVWVRNRSWTHTNGWNPPPKQVVEQGPVVIVTRRWGHLPRAREVEVEVVYHFFSNTPYCFIESTMDVKEDLVVNALRNEEFVVAPPEDVDHCGWRRPNGDIAYIPMVPDPNLTPGIVAILEPDAPYVCMTREANGLGIASLRLVQQAGSRGDAAPVVANARDLPRGLRLGLPVLEPVPRVSLGRPPA